MLLENVNSKIGSSTSDTILKVFNNRKVDLSGDSI